MSIKVVVPKYPRMGRMMDAETIRTLDGPSLTRLAWKLGLAPEDAQPFPGREHVLGRWKYDSPKQLNYTVLDVWEPHKDIDQATVVFRQLRTRGWFTRINGADTWGEAYAEKGFANTYSRHRGSWPGLDAGPRTEAYTLLLIAVLAVAREKEPDHDV